MTIPPLPPDPRPTEAPEFYGDCAEDGHEWVPYGEYQGIPFCRCRRCGKEEDL